MIHSNCYMKSVSMGISEALQYRLNFVFNLLSCIFPVTIQVFLWNAVYSNSSNKLVYGFSYHQMILYTLYAAVVAKFISGGFESLINDDIKNGGLNKYIIRPVNYFTFRASCFLGKKLIDSIVLFLLFGGIISLSLFYFHEEISIIRIVLFIVSLILAGILNFLIIYGFSAMAFWINDASSIFLILYLTINILSGGIFPVEIFGEFLNGIFDFLPFKYTLYYPVVIINQKITQDHALVVLLIQAIWIFVIWLLGKTVWKRGIKSYLGVGG